MSNPFYTTKYGKFFLDDSAKLINSLSEKEFKNKFQLIVTSPPFPLNSKKKYGNLQGEAYKSWFESLAPAFAKILAPNGSIVMEIGNSWESKRPVQSLLHLESLLSFVKNSNANLNLIQEFICYNPSRLPSPAVWVTRERIRTVDSYTHIWWMSNSDFPKADNRKVLRPYSKGMLSLLKRQKYNTNKRPSQHSIGEKSFLKNNGGSIAHNLFELESIDVEREVRLPHNVLSFSNNDSSDYYHLACRKQNIVPHPARMHAGVVNFFMEFLTDEGDWVLDPFAGSNTTGLCAERLKRNWVSIEIDKDFAKQSIFRFEDPELNTDLKVNKKAL